jgi:hypothetical protein
MPTLKLKSMEVRRLSFKLKSDAQRFFIKLRVVLVLGLKKLNFNYLKGVS